MTESVRGSIGRGLPVARELGKSGYKGEVPGDRVIAEMIGCACNGKTGGRKDAVRCLTWASG